jgi:hypothetical protein
MMKQGSPIRDISRISAYLLELYLKDEECTEIPSRHLSLVLGSPHFLFPLRYTGVESKKKTVFDFIDSFNPCRGTVLSWSPGQLNAPMAIVTK